MPTVSAVVWALIPAAGVGLRMQADLAKQYLPILGRPIILHTLERLAAVEAVNGIFVGLAKGDEQWPSLLDQVKQIGKYRGSFIGGADRAHTILNGCKAIADIAEPQDWILIHDAVRPCVRVDDINALMSDIINHQAVGGLLAMPIADTVKRVDKKNQITETVSRIGLWRALTPQIFRLADIIDAIELALAEGIEITDDASAMEFAEKYPRVVMGHADNIKVTQAEDLALAEVYLKQQLSEGS